MAIASVIGGGAAHAVYCERCERWYSDRRLGFVEAEAKETALNAVRTHDWPTLKTLLKPTPPSGAMSYLSLRLSACAQCSEGILKADELVRQKDQMKTIPLFAETVSSADVAAVSDTGMRV
jgi:hypothetical protein